MRQLLSPNSQMLNPRQGTSSVIVSSQLAGVWFGNIMEKICEYCKGKYTPRDKDKERSQKYCNPQCSVGGIRIVNAATLNERFWAKVNPPDENGCMNWKTHANQHYGQFHYKSKVCGAHRVSWELHFGPIPNDLYVLHKCDNTKCVNPSHLFLGTQKDNLQDAKKKGRMPKGEKHYRAKLKHKKEMKCKP